MWPGLTSQRWLGNRLWRALLKSGGSLQALASRSRLAEVKLPPVMCVVNTSGNVFLISTWLPTEAQSKGGMSVEGLARSSVITVCFMGVRKFDSNDSATGRIASEKLFG